MIDTRFFLYIPIVVIATALIVSFLEYLYDKWDFSKNNTLRYKDLDDVRIYPTARIFHNLEREIVKHVYIPFIIAIKGSLIKVDGDRFWIFTRSKRKLRKAFFALKKKKYLKDSNIEIILYKKGNYDYNANLFACRSKTWTSPMPILYL